jgi:hypothetical protein
MVVMSVRNRIALFSFALVLALIQTSCRSPEAATAANSSINTQAQREATVAYWDALYTINAQIDLQLNQIEASLETNRQNGATPFDMLPEFSEQISQVADAYTRRVSALPVLDVDERLILETTEDLKNSSEISNHFKTMSEAVVSYAGWCQRKDHPPTAKMVVCVFDSIAGAFEGSPFIGYDEIREEETQMDEEGQQIIETYLTHLKALNGLINESAADKAKEIQLRSYLSSKYGVEFKPLPEFSSSNDVSRNP